MGDVEEPEVEPPKAELTDEEKKQWFRKCAVKDRSEYLFNMSFTKFSLPEKDEAFDDIVYQWQKADKCKEYLTQWIRDRKQMTRVEDLQPSEWFVNKWKEWQKAVGLWHQKQNQYKAVVAKRAQEAAARKAKRAEKTKAKALEAAAKAKKEAEEAAKKEAEEA